MVNERLDLRCLKDREFLISKREQMSREDLALELNCHSGSIRWAERLLSPEEKKNFVFVRVHKKEGKNAS